MVEAVGDGIVAVPVVRIRQGDIKELMGSMESKSSIVREHVLARAFTGGQSAKHKIEFKRDAVEKTLPPPRPHQGRRLPHRAQGRSHGVLGGCRAGVALGPA